MNSICITPHLEVGTVLEVFCIREAFVVKETATTYVIRSHEDVIKHLQKLFDGVEGCHQSFYCVYDFCIPKKDYIISQELVEGSCIVKFTISKFLCVGVDIHPSQCDSMEAYFMNGAYRETSDLSSARVSSKEALYNVLENQILQPKYHPDTFKTTHSIEIKGE